MVSSPPQPPPPPTMASLNVVVDDENHRTRSTIMSHHYRISYFCSIVFYLQISLLLTTCSTAWALRLYVPSELNYPSSVLANLSLPTPRMYRMSGDLNAPFIHRFVDVTTIDGMLFLKHTLRCRSESPRDVVTSPLNLYIESRSYSIEGSSNHLTLLHVQLYFDHETCFNTINEMKSRPHLDLDNMINTNPEIIFTKQLQQQQQTSSVSYALLSLNNDRLCVDKCQFLARLPNLIPTSMKNQCKMVYSVIGSNWIDEQFKLEHSTNDLISLQHECINHGSSFNVQIGLLYSCDQHSTKHHYHHHNRKHQQTTWLPSEKVEIIQLTFYAREVDIEQFILQLQQSALQHNHHHHINSSPTRHVYIDHSTTINENQNNNNNNASFVNESGNRSRREASSSSSQHSSGPTFDRSLYIVSVPEEREKSFVVTQIVANPSTPSDDRASTELLYTMSALIDARSQSMFAIDPVSGLVTTTTRLDREFMDVHYLRITVTDSHVPPHSASTTLQVNVLDENDHVPVFEHANYEWSLKESAPIGTTVLTVRATDHDSGPNSDIEYSLLNPTGSNEAFRIDPKQGVIVTRTSLDRERIDQYTLTVQATDSGPIQSRKRSQTNVGIKILDENDNYPQFAERSYSVSVDEDINYASRPVIIRVVSHDADEGMNAAVRYSIIGGNTAAVFQIDSLNGEVSVVGPLDYENSRSYRLVIRAQDGGSPPRSNTTQLLVNVIDKNDNEPRFYTSVFQENVLENVPIGTSVVRVQAYDADDGENSQLSYHIQMGKNTMAMDESLNSMMPIAIDPTTGWIVTTRELDREEASLYEFSVVARDAGTPIQHTATASVIIRVQDLNDNAPVFEPRNYDAVIPETAVPGTPVVTVAATDRDENSRLVFQITGGNVRNRFAIVSQNNQGHITVANLLDYKVEKSYILTVTATDPGGKMDLATVYINVTDANTHRPVIQLKNGAGTYGSTTTTIAEDAPVGTTVMVVEASDDDVGENARITYSLNDVGEFRIDPNSGAIVTTKQLDRETNAGYTLVVTAQDNGIPPLSDIANIEIEVIDVNDNVPQFEQEFYSANVMEDAPIGTSVAHVRAHDRDLGLNGQVRYEFDPTMFASIDGTNPNGVFVIDPTSGVIRTNKSLDRETTAKYDLKVIAFDRGTPSLSSTIVVQVTIDDCNDNPPRFASDRLRFYVPENSPIGSVVGELRATDADVGPNAKIEYTIVGGPDMKWFALKSGSTSSSSSPSALALTDHSQQSAIDSMQSNHDSSSSSSSVALLITRTEMDFESEKKIYNIIVRASSLPLRNDVDVEIHVTDVNDHAPLLRDFSIVFNNYRGHFPLGQVIGRVPAYDADVADQLRYRFVSGNKANLLLLNETTGDLRLSPSLNTNVPTRALLEVSVSDSINEAVARCFLSVNLVTEAMLFHSVTIRLNRVGRRHFLSSLYERFLEGLASVIPCPKENIIIFNIQDDTESENNSILNISFSARLSESLRDTESYHSPQFLQERVYLSRTLLTRLTDLEVLPFDDNLCVREPCLNYEECLSVLKFGNASDFFATEAMLFRAISPVNTFACRCPNGFQGMHHKYECDIEVNLCFSSPCQNDGQCVHQESGYVCLCSDGFAGKNCEVNFSNDFCRNGLCRGGSRCINGAARAMKVKPSMVRAGLGLDKALLESAGSTGPGGFLCADCPFEEWGTPLCELRTRSFVPGSYLTFSALRQRYRLNLKLRFATKEPNGLLVYNGRYNEKHDFIGLELINGRLHFSFSLGGINRASVSVGHRLNDGQWHEIEVNYINRTATLKLDNCDEALLNAIERYDLGPEFFCANKTTMVIESRCSDRMQTCFRFLDLTGPLQIGGLPPLPTTFQVANKDFHGCISDLHVDYNLIDFDTYVANNGTTIGCDSKKSYCTPNTCNQHGTCEDAWKGYVCRCNDGYTGQDCLEEVSQATRSFRGDGFLSFTPNLQPLAYPWLVSFDIKTIARKAVILSVQLGQNSLVKWEIFNGKLSYTVDSRSPIILEDMNINDGKWHHVETRWMANGVTLNVDYGQYSKHARFESVDILGLYIAKVNVGGYDTPDELTDADLYRSTAPSFVGCLQALDVGNSKDSWLRPMVENNVYDGCQRGSVEAELQDPCRATTDPCPEHSDCLPLGLSGHQCKCHRGFVGKHCTQVCDLNPCAFGSSCVPANNTYGYRCLCDRHHSGFYCEDRLPETCPTDWWGYPICGPCNCDVSKGYDGNCNKTTGECSCQSNRFQPPGSDVCFECDCYSTGSYTSRCDRLTGQCPCRPGVIGRRCDTCASPFAEVTNKGCEVIYYACPRAISEGVWWERTSFGQKSQQKCPLGSSGMAERYCAEGEGWSKPDLFGCLSDQFLDLAEQWKILDESDKASEENKSILLNTQHSIRLVNDLRSAINQTEPLYGNDLHLAFRLIRRLILNELRQSGLNLTHKQDRHFLRNLCESTSAILEPRYSSMWERIAETDSIGPEQFIKLFNQYAEVLIDNQRDTFTEPFEISTKWLTFGLDTVATNELWDVSKEVIYRSSSKSSELNTKFDYFPTTKPKSVSLNRSSSTSIYLDFSLPIDPLASGIGPLHGDTHLHSNPAVIIPKYNNYPLRKHNIDDITKAIIPLRLLNVPTLDDVRTRVTPLQSNGNQNYFKPTQNALIGYTIFTSMAHFLPSNTDSTVRQRFSMPIKANTPIITLTMKSANSSKFLMKSLHPKLHFRFRTLAREGRSSPQCVYWAFPSSTSSVVATSGAINTRKMHSRGRWSSKGCELKGYFPQQKFRASYDYINCSCDRAFGMAVLMDISGDEFYFEESLTQVAVSYTLVIISLILLVISYMTLTLMRGLETNSNSIHKNLVLCLFFTELIFLLGVRMRTSLVQYESICKLTAIFLHYAFQCLFTWMLIESIHLYRMLTEIRDVNHGPMRFYYFLGYTTPAIIVALSVGVRADQYGNHLFCWLSIYEGVIWGLVAPICVIIVANLFVFLLALQASVQIKAQVCDYGNLRTMLWLSIILLPLFAALWILALLAVNDAVDELHYAFSFVALISSLYIFIGYCLINRRVRHNIQLSWQRITSGTRSPGSDESFSATRTSVTGSRGALYHQSPAHGQLQGSNFDVYGIRSATMGGQLDVIGGPVISSSSTTSRSTVTKGSGQILDGEEPLDTLDDTEDTDGCGHRHKHRHSHRHSRHHHHNHKCHRRHRRHRHHRSKQSMTGTETGSSDDASYDRSMELASSHSSDDDDDGPGHMMIEPGVIHNPLSQEEMLQQQQENQINTIIAEHHQQTLYGQSGSQIGLGSINQPTNSSDGGVSSGANTVIYGQRTIKGIGGTPAIIKQNMDNSNQAHLVTSMPFSRSNILAMTAGLSDGSSTSNSQTRPVGGGNTPSPAPPLGMSPASSIQSHIYSSGELKSSNNPIASATTTTEHIYSYARKPTMSIAPSQTPQSITSSAHSSTIYSTIGPVNTTPAISDDIGLPPILPNITYRVSGTLPHLMGNNLYQVPKENPYGMRPSIVNQPSHVRLLNASDSLTEVSSMPAIHPHNESSDNNRNETMIISGVNDSSNRSQQLFQTNNNADLSDGTNHEGDAV